MKLCVNVYQIHRVFLCISKNTENKSLTSPHVISQVFFLTKTSSHDTVLLSNTSTILFSACHLLGKKKSWNVHVGDCKLVIFLLSEPYDTINSPFKQ